MKIQITNNWNHQFTYTEGHFQRMFENYGFIPRIGDIIAIHEEDCFADPRLREWKDRDLIVVQDVYLRINHDCISIELTQAEFVKETNKASLGLPNVRGLMIEEGKL